MSTDPRQVVLEKWRTFPDRLAVAALAFRRSVPVGEWTPVEVVRHLIAVEREVWWVRFPSLVTESEPRWSWVEPGLDADSAAASLDAVLDRFRDVRARTVGIVDGFAASDWARTGVHATFGRLDATALLRIVTDHDEEHLASLSAD